MQKRVFFIFLLFIAVSYSSSAQVIIRPNNLGINTLNPLSNLSVNDDGDARYGIYSISNSSASGNTGIFGESQGFPFNTITGNFALGVRGFVTSGAGATIGVRGDATNASVSGNGRAYGVYGVASNSTPGFNYGVWGQVSGSNQGTGILGWDQVNYPSWNQDVGDFWAAYFVGDAHVSEKMTIGTTNRPTMVGINNTTDYRLFVCGGILAEEWLIPSVTWCDYVFEKDYDLKSLPEVEQHIAIKGHLHNTPSAEKIENNGLEVAKMTVNQQEKIEELFLHMIEMDKRVKALEEKNEQLEEENRELKAALKLD